MSVYSSVSCWSGCRAAAYSPFPGDSRCQTRQGWALKWRITEPSQCSFGQNRSRAGRSTAVNQDPGRFPGEGWVKMKARLIVLCAVMVCGATVCWSRGNAAELPIRYNGSVMSVAFSPEGNVVATGGGQGLDEPGEVILWDAQTGTILRRLHGHSELVVCVAFSPDGKTLARTPPLG